MKSTGIEMLLSCFFITTGKIDPQSQAFVISQQPPEYPADTVDLDERCEWHYIDESELNIQFRSARDLHKGGQGQKIDLYAVGPKGRRGTDAVLEVKAGAYSSFILDSGRATDCTSIQGPGAGRLIFSEYS